MDTVDVEAGPWGPHLAGTALPKPELAITVLAISVRGNQVRAPSAEPFLPMVRSAEGFETVDLDSSGRGKVAVPAGESVILLQAGDVWEIRLLFRERQEA